MMPQEIVHESNARLSEEVLEQLESRTRETVLNDNNASRKKGIPKL